MKKYRIEHHQSYDCPCSWEEMVEDNNGTHYLVAEVDTNLQLTIETGMKWQQAAKGMTKQITALKALIENHSTVEIDEAIYYVSRPVAEEITVLTADLAYWKNIASERVAVNIENTTLKEENMLLKEALEEYADKSKYSTHTERDTNAMGREYESIYIVTDIGPEIAQAVLKVKLEVEE